MKRNITKAEWQVMELLWSKGDQDSRSIVRDLAEKQGWAANTSRTLLTRLVKKKMVKVLSMGEKNIYSSIVTKEAAIRQEGEGFLEQCFGGVIEDLVVHFASRSKLSKNTIEQVKALLRSEKRK